MKQLVSAEKPCEGVSLVRKVAIPVFRNGHLRKQQRSRHSLALVSPHDFNKEGGKADEKTTYC